LYKWDEKRPELPVNSIAQIFIKPLDKYSIENLGKRQYDSEIVLDSPIATYSAYTVYNFHFDSDGKRVTGLAHVPQQCPCPVIIQFRGYVEHDAYQPGVGTKRSAQAFAQNGFISLAPDGLGYGGSDNPSSDVFEERFQTYTTGLNLLAATEHWSLSTGQLGLWGHSNGGQQAITLLEISGKPYPTVLWAPVTKPFPYSILYYTDEADDKGKALRKKLAEFEKDYDVDFYSLPSYLYSVTAPIQLDQGSGDEAVPQKWSDEFVSHLKKENPDIQIDYFVYHGADHNMSGTWNAVISRDLEFFHRYLN
jgi:alpha-beta hydrolase superfamily lysophospholipase